VLAGVAGAVVYLVLVLYFGLVPEDVRSRMRTMWRSGVEAVS